MLGPPVVVPDRRDSSDDEGVDKANKVLRKGINTSLHNYTILKNEKNTNPERIVQEFLEEVMEDVGLEKDDLDVPIKLTDHFKFVPFKHHGTLKRAYTLNLWALQDLLRGNTMECAAQLVRNQRTLIQCAIDGGSWEKAWDLSYVPDPFKSRQFGGTMRELEVISMKQKQMAELNKRQQKPHEDEHDEQKKPWWQKKKEERAAAKGQPKEES